MADDPKPLASTPAQPGATTMTARQPKLRYQDRPEVGETFADSIHSCVFDGQLMRIEFTVARFDEPGVLGILEGRQVPVSRLVLSRTALGDLIGRLGQLSDALKRAGLTPAGAQPATPGATAPTGQPIKL